MFDFDCTPDVQQMTQKVKPITLIQGLQLRDLQLPDKYLCVENIKKAYYVVCYFGCHVGCHVRCHVVYEEVVFHLRRGSSIKIYKQAGAELCQAQAMLGQHTETTF